MAHDEAPDHGTGPIPRTLFLRESIINGALSTGVIVIVYVAITIIASIFSSEELDIAVVFLISIFLTTAIGSYRRMVGIYKDFAEED